MWCPRPLQRVGTPAGISRSWTSSSRWWRRRGRIKPQLGRTTVRVYRARRAKGARPPSKCVLPGSCPEPPALWFPFFVGVTNLGYRRVAWCTTTVLQWQQYLLTAIRFTLSKKQKERSEAGTETELILQAHAVSFYLVRWVGVSSVFGENKLTCDWSK